ncbi:MAG: serine/threonine-protein kinase [Myxococcota bacterium]
MTFEVGTTYAFGEQDVSQYIIVEELKGGGFGRVFVAHRHVFGFNMGDVVLKVPVDLSVDGLARFEREATLMANVVHPNVAGVLSYYPATDARGPILVQERIPGAQKLDQVVVAMPHQVHNIEALPSLYLQALYALDAIHASNIVHRDITLGNVLVGFDNRLRVIDFGLSYDAASDATRMTKTGQLLGTVGFIAPELLKDPKNVDHRADYYSLGKVLCSVLCGHDAQHVTWHNVDDGPWKDVTRQLCDNDRSNRYISGEQAIADALNVILRENLPLPTSSLKHHGECLDKIAERETYFRPSAWHALMHRAIVGPLNWDKVEALGSLPIGFLQPAELETIIAEASKAGPLRQALDSYIPFDLVDPLATMLHRLFVICQTPTKYNCFADLVTLAVRYRRFMAMGLVRRCFEISFQPDVVRALVEILDAHDPETMILGRGIIPGRE